MNRQTLIAAAAFAACLAQPAAAGSITYTLLDVVPDDSYTISNTGQGYDGPGYVGLYGPGGFEDNTFVNLLGMESTDYSKTLVLVDISALAGSTIDLAQLSYKLLDGAGSGGTTEIRGFAIGPQLTYIFNAPTADYGIVTQALAAGQNQSFNITAIVQAAVTAGASRLGLHMQNTVGSNYRWTYTRAEEDGTGPDTAQMRLTVRFDGGGQQVSEPATLALLGAGLLGLAAFRRRRAV